MTERDERAIDTEPLGEDVTTHTMMGFHEHDDGRGCMFHSRLNSWATGWPVTLRCLREHPDPFARRTTPAPTTTHPTGEASA